VSLDTDFHEAVNRSIFDELMADTAKFPNRELVEKVWAKTIENPWNGPLLYEIIQVARPDFQSGDVIGLKGGRNEYKVLAVQGGHAELECISFRQPEDLGDGIKTTKVGDRVWIAHLFFKHLLEKIA
jgi:hypothetical protein